MALDTLRLFCAKRRSEAQKHTIQGIYGRSEKNADDSAAHEQDEDQADNSQRVINAESVVRQHVSEDVASVKRRQRQQVEDRQQQVDDEAEIKQKSDGKHRG